MPTSHQQQALARDLDQVFVVPRMTRVWKKHVRTGLRRQPLLDLHDFLDVHRNIHPYLQALRTEVLAGQYRPHPPEVTLLEKRDGIPRRLSLPSPADAILLQTVVEVLEVAMLQQQPHPNAYYAQSHSPPSEADVDGTFAYPWWVLWPQFQQRIWRFTATYPFVVVTDIANFYDCIPLRALRNRVASFGAFKEGVLDFLFYLLDAFTWRPFYMPQTGVGLPQINFDAPRLLAHAYLFPIDEELQQRTSGDFVRWMDDIDCGVPSRENARELLRGLEVRLNSLGIRLNAAKTKVLAAKEAVAHFWIHENRAITVLSNLLAQTTPGSLTWVSSRAYARKRFQRFVRKPQVGQADKIYKRYLKLFGVLKDPTAERHVPSLLDNHPGLRGAVSRYYTALGPSAKRLRHVEKFLTSGRVLDDASLFELVRVLVQWRGQVSGRRRSAIVRIATAVSAVGSDAILPTSYTVSGLSSSIWLLAKYGSPAELTAALRSSQQAWARSSWVARQVAAVLPLVPEPARTELRKRVIGTGLAEALRVLANLDSLTNLTSLDLQLKSYLTHPPPVGENLPLEKVIIARVVLNGKLQRAQKRLLRNTMSQLILDPSLRSLLTRRL